MNISNSLFTSTEINSLFDQAHALQQELAASTNPAAKQTKIDQLDRLLRKIAHIAKLEVAHPHDPKQLQEAKELCLRALKFLNSDPLRAAGFEPLDKLQHKFNKAIKKADLAQQKLSGNKKYLDPPSEYQTKLQALTHKTPHFCDLLSLQLDDTATYLSRPPHIERLRTVIPQLDGSLDPLVALSETPFFSNLAALQPTGLTDSAALNNVIAQLRPFQGSPGVQSLVNHLEKLAKMNPEERVQAKPAIGYFLPRIEDEITLLKELQKLKQEHPQETQELMKTLQTLYANAQAHAMRIVRFLELTRTAWGSLHPQDFPKDPALMNPEQRRALIIYHMAMANILDRFDVYSSLQHFKNAQNEALVNQFLNWMLSMPIGCYRRADLDLITSNLPDPQLTYSIRLDCLRLLQSTFPAESPHTILILGAGPAGLTRSLLFTLQNIPVRVLEKRQHPLAQEGRENIIMLGIRDTNDLRILNFLGVLPLAQAYKIVGATTPIDPHALPIKIRDLERCMTEVQEALKPGVITYEAPKFMIVKDEQGAHFFAGSTEMRATILLDCTGRHSPLLETLGITPQRISEKVFLGTSKFTGSASWVDEAWYRLRAPAVLIAKAAEALRKTSFSAAAVAQHIFHSSPALLLRVQNYDSLGIVLSKEDQAAFKQQMKAIAILDGKLREAREKGMPESDPHVLNLARQRTEAIAAMNQALQGKSEEVRMFYDTLLCLQIPTHRLKSLAYVSGSLVDVTMVRTEQPLFIIGGKAALVRGDAHGTTDPMSAHGAKVAIESALADQFYLKMTERPGNETLAQILFTDMAEAFLAKSQAEGFYMRAKFHEHTEAYQYFMELGRASGWATQHEVGQLAALFDRGQFALEDRDFAKLSPVEGEFLMNLREKIYSRAQLFELPESYKQDPILATLVKDLKHPILTISPAEELEAKKMASELLFKPDLKDLGIALGLLLIIDSTARRLKSSQ